ncbi:MAG: TlpA disulfide reductase family protein [Lutibacter sp.]|uniref:TlpA family protein disulfide reductase n=1 Tax=Lutibacter sp. TaxID=1925666 RepID=UPI00385FB2FE
MKNLGFFILAILVLSCQEKVPVDYTIISGKITNKAVGKVSINSSDRTIKEVLNIAEDGSFSDTLKVKTGTYMFFDGKNRISVYINAGDNLKINYDATNFDTTLAISGKGSEISNYLLASSKKEKELRGKGTSIYLLEEDEYKATLNSIKIASEELLANTIGLPEAYKIKEQRNLNYAYLGGLKIYQRYHEHYAKKPDFKISEGFLAELEGLDYLNEEDFMFSSSYKGMVTSHYFNEASVMAEKDSITEDIAFLITVGSLTNETIKNSLLFENAKYGITYTDDVENFYKIFVENSTNEENNKKITESYNKLKTVAKGQPSPTFENYENFAGGTISLNDLKGKFVYVDVWATWCGPCKREIPFLQKVEKQYHGKNIEFVSLSVDKLGDHDKWKKMVEEQQLGGIQLFADNSWESDFVKDYLIKGIPRFILIDPKGNIVNSNAPRPSNNKLIDLFNELKI